MNAKIPSLAPIWVFAAFLTLIPTFSLIAEKPVELQDALAAEDWSAAALLAEKKAEDGDPFAQYVYGTMLMQGRGVPVDIPSAATWLETAGRQEQLDALLLLGLMHFREIAPDSRIWKAWLYLRIAYHSGKEDAASSIGIVEAHMTQEDHTLGVIALRKWEKETGMKIDYN